MFPTLPPHAFTPTMVRFAASKTTTPDLSEGEQSDRVDISTASTKGEDKESKGSSFNLPGILKRSLVGLGISTASDGEEAESSTVSKGRYSTGRKGMPPRQRIKKRLTPPKLVTDDSQTTNPRKKDRKDKKVGFSPMLPHPEETSETEGFLPSLEASTSSLRPHHTRRRTVSSINTISSLFPEPVSRNSASTANSSKHSLVIPTLSHENSATEDSKASPISGMSRPHVASAAAPPSPVIPTIRKESPYQGWDPNDSSDLSDSETSGSASISEGEEAELGTRKRSKSQVERDAQPFKAGSKSFLTIELERHNAAEQKKAARRAKREARKAKRLFADPPLNERGDVKQYRQKLQVETAAALQRSQGPAELSKLNERADQYDVNQLETRVRESETELERHLTEMKQLEQKILQRFPKDLAKVDPRTTLRDLVDLLLQKWKSDHIKLTLAAEQLKSNDDAGIVAHQRKRRNLEAKETALDDILKDTQTSYEKLASKVESLQKEIDLDRRTIQFKRRRDINSFITLACNTESASQKQTSKLQLARDYSNSDILDMRKFLVGKRNSGDGRVSIEMLDFLNQALENQALRSRDIGNRVNEVFSSSGGSSEQAKFEHALVNDDHYSSVLIEGAMQHLTHPNLVDKQTFILNALNKRQQKERPEASGSFAVLATLRRLLGSSL